MSNVNLSTGLPQDQTGDKPYLQFGNQFQTSGIHSSLFNNVDFNTMMWPQSLLTQALANGTLAPVIPNPLVGYRIQLPDGSATSPALGWTEAAESASGLYRIGANDYGYEVAGSLVTEWKSAEFRVNYLTPGSVVFAGTSGKLEQDNASFFWDDTSNFLKLESSIGKQLRLQYDSTTWSDLTVDVNGNLVSTLTTGPQWYFKAFTPIFNITGTNTNQTVTFRLLDNSVTLKSQLYYDGGAAAGSRATILQNYGGDYLQFQSNGSIRFTDKFAGTEYVRFLGNGDVSFGTGSFYWDNTNLSLNQDGGAAAANVAHRFRVSGDTQNRFQITADGAHTWGDGASTPDVTLYRFNARTLRLESPSLLSVALRISSDAGNLRSILYSTAGVSRWSLATDATAEAGANAGSDFVIGSRSDAGAALRTDLTLTRSTGLWSIGGTVQAGTDASFDMGNSSFRWRDLRLSRDAYIQSDTGTIQFGTSSDLILSRASANILALRNSTTSNSIRIYNTFTDASNGEWWESLWSANTCLIRTSKNGTGTARAMALQYGDANTAISIPAAITSMIGVGTGGSASHTGGILDVGNLGSYSRLTSTNHFLSFSGTVLDSGSNSSTVWNYINVAPTINYTGVTKSGKIRGIYINPTNTSLPTGQSSAIELSATSSTLGGFVLNNQADEDTNYEKLTLKAVSNVWTIASVKGGTGTVRSIGFATGGTSAWTLDASQILFPAGTLATGMTTGFLNIPGAAGAPTGAPATTTGFPLYWDSTNLQLYVYTGGAWKKSAAFT